MFLDGLLVLIIGMEISPDASRRAYSGYFNALTAPAYLLPLIGGFLAVAVGYAGVFALAALGAGMQWGFVRSTRIAGSAAS